MAEDDRRAALEAAFEAAEEEEETVETPAEETPAEEETPTEETSEAPAEETPAEEAPAKDTPTKAAEDQAPASWKAPLKSKWGSVDPEIRQEVWRREREVTRALSESATARQVAKSLVETAAPFSARLQAQGVNPLVAFRNLLLADHRLSSGTKQQRAQLIAGLIKDYEVDILTLDSVLAGTTNPAAAEEDRLTRLLNERLTPIQKQLQSYQAREQAETQATEQTLQQHIATMSHNTQEFPFFEQVRDAMADLVEINASRGVSLDLKTAYNRAVAADPELSSQVESTRQSTFANQATQRVQRAKQASLSVNGAPSGESAQSFAGNDRRATITAAFDALGG